MNLKKFKEVIKPEILKYFSMDSIITLQCIDDDVITFHAKKDDVIIEFTMISHVIFFPQMTIQDLFDRLFYAFFDMTVFVNNERIYYKKYLD